MKSLENRIVKLEQSNGNCTINFFYEIACQFATKQDKPKPEKPHDSNQSIKQLSALLPN